MPKDFLKGAADHYDVVVIGSGLGGLTAANILAREGRSVLLLEQHYKLCLLYTSPSPRDKRQSRMPSSA